MTGPRRFRSGRNRLDSPRLVQGQRQHDSGKSRCRQPVLRNNTFCENDPVFVNAANGDFHLRPGFSAAIDVGDPDPVFDDVDGSRNDIGAYGGPGGAW